MADAKVLSTRALNRALLARQMLLTRENTTPVKAVERLGGMQAQQPRPPFVGLWSRLEGFDRESLRAAIRDRTIVRATMMRGTLHLTSAADYLTLRSALQPALTAGMKSIQKARAAVLDEERVTAAAAQCFASRPYTFGELRGALALEFPEVDERMMGYLARMCIPLVMVPDESEFCYAGATFAAAASWLGKPIETAPQPDKLVRSYLGAFGPASVRDCQTWSALGGLEAVFEALRPKLRVFRDERGRELFDLPNAPRPAEDTPAPVRFLPAFDNIILSHADRTRIIADEHRPRVSTKNLQILPTFLVDGFVAGLWEAGGTKKKAALKVTPFGTLSRTTKGEVEAEGESLIRFVAPGATAFEVVFGKV